MIKIKNAVHSNLFFGTVMFLGFLLTWGCAKNVAPPDVEEVPAPVVEQIPEPGSEPEIDLTQEGVEGIQESDADFNNEFDTSGPDVIEEIDVVEVPGESQEFAAQDFDSGAVADETPQVQMDMNEDVFVAPGAEAIQETRLIPDFRDEQQLQDVHFEYDRDKLDSQTKSILKANADWLKKNPNARVEIQGHADERGTNNYNLGLGERRALQTKKYLIKMGIDESRLYTISYGEEKPFCFDSNENCWWENRRAHFTVAD